MLFILFLFLFLPPISPFDVSVSINDSDRAAAFVPHHLISDATTPVNSNKMFCRFAPQVILCSLLFVNGVYGTTDDFLTATRPALYGLHLDLSVPAKHLSDRFESQEVKTRVFASELTQKSENLLSGAYAFAIMPPLFHTLATMYMAIQKSLTFAAFPHEHYIAFWAWIPGLPCGARALAMSHQAFKSVLCFVGDRRLNIPPISSFLSIPSPNYSTIHERRPDLISPIDNEFRSATLPPIENAILVLKYISTRIDTTKDIRMSITAHLSHHVCISFVPLSKTDRCMLTKQFTAIHDFDTPIIVSEMPDGVCDASLPDIEHDTKYVIYLGSNSDCVSMACLNEGANISSSALERFNACLPTMRRLIASGYNFKFPLDSLRPTYKTTWRLQKFGE